MLIVMMKAILSTLRIECGEAAPDPSDQLDFDLKASLFTSNLTITMILIKFLIWVPHKCKM